FFADDRLEIVGVQALIDENNSFIARSITKDDGKTLTLRRADGTPIWSPAIDGADGCGVNHPALPRGTERCRECATGRLIGRVRCSGVMEHVPCENSCRATRKSPLRRACWSSTTRR